MQRLAIRASADLKDCLWLWIQPVASFSCGSASVAVSIYSEPESSIRGCQVTGDTPCNAGRCISLNPMDRRKGSMVNILRGQADKTATDSERNDNDR